MPQNSNSTSLNDQAETVLQHLLRGAGTAGLSGMKAKNEDIIRPFYVYIVKKLKHIV